MKPSLRFSRVFSIVLGFVCVLVAIAYGIKGEPTTATQFLMAAAFLVVCHVFSVFASEDAPPVEQATVTRIRREFTPERAR